MSTFQLYKKRDFNAFIGDTIQFFKVFPKNYLINFALINGGFIIIFGILTATYNNFSLSGLTNNRFSGSDDPTFDSSMILFFIILLVIVAFVYSVLSVAYPMAYLNLVDNTGRNSFSASEIFNKMKELSNRIILFHIISMFTLIPLMMLVVVISALLIIIIIGIPILFLSVIVFLTWSFQSLYVYTYDETGYFDSLKKGWGIVRRKFWHIVGSTLVLLLCITAVNAIFNVIPFFISIGSTVTSGISQASFLIKILSFTGLVVSSILYNLMYVHQGLIFYSSIETTEHIQTYSEIDSIGNNEE